MSPLVHGVISGFAFGGLAVVSMIPMKFPDKAAALTAAFLDRFAIGLFIPLVKTSVSAPGWLLGLSVGVLLSLPSAIITKAYAPIMIIGSVGGVVIGTLA